MKGGESMRFYGISQFCSTLQWNTAYLKRHGTTLRNLYYWVIFFYCKKITKLYFKLITGKHCSHERTINCCIHYFWATCARETKLTIGSSLWQWHLSKAALVFVWNSRPFGQWTSIWPISVPINFSQLQCCKGGKGPPGWCLSLHNYGSKLAPNPSRCFFQTSVASINHQR